MSRGTSRIVTEDGEVPIPDEIRERVGIEAGDEVRIRISGETVLIEKPGARTELAAGYRARAARDREIERQFATLSRPATDSIGEAPDW